jgi:hypothetical protein
MPIGSSKLGVLGAGLVPGGTATFNASGTFSVPPGVKKVSITGKGATGNPGNAGNSGNAGLPGSGGAGGAGGTSRKTSGGQFNTITGGFAGGAASRPGMVDRASITLFPTVSPCSAFQSWRNAGTAPPTWINQISIGASFNFAPGSSQSGQNGAAGTAGNPGNPGNTGESSSGLGNTFVGGAGGSAGVGGNAGNGGSGGTAGAKGQGATLPACGNNASGGSGGNGGGSGGNGTLHTAPGCGANGRGGTGGGGAGTTNDGFAGTPSSVLNADPAVSRGGEDAQVSAPVSPIPFNFSPATSPANLLPANTMGGGGGRSAVSGGAGANAIRFGTLDQPINDAGYSNQGQDRQSNRVNLPQFSPAPLAPNIVRSGGGGGASASDPNVIQWKGGGGGGGGGRGNAGNAGGASSTPSGSAATPQTFNCVPVTPGGTTPITVAAPGGQVVISWNPQ